MVYPKTLGEETERKEAPWGKPHKALSWRKFGNTKTREKRQTDTNSLFLLFFIFLVDFKFLNEPNVIRKGPKTDQKAHKKKFSAMKFDLSNE